MLPHLIYLIKGKLKKNINFSHYYNQIWKLFERKNIGQTRYGNVKLGVGKEKQAHGGSV